VKHFKRPEESLGGLNPKTTAALIAAASDIALIIDSKGVIQDIACGSDELADEGLIRWVGKPWADTVALDSRDKIKELLHNADPSSMGRSRHVNHISRSGEDIPILYSAIQIDPDGRSVAVGRDLRAQAEIQQRLIEAQQSMERDYWRLRHVETRYRLLFQLASEAVLVVDAASMKVAEANPAACEFFGESGNWLIGRLFPVGFDGEGMRAINGLLTAVRSNGKAEPVKATAISGDHTVNVSASLFRQENASYFLVRLATINAKAPAAAPKARSMLLRFLENAPDGFVVTDMQGKILTANAAFVELTQLAAEGQVEGESIERWLGRPGVDFSVLSANLRQNGSIRLFATTIRGEYGATAEVEISAVSVPLGDPPCLGFSIRNVGNRLSPAPRANGREAPRSVEQLTELVGRVPLKDLVREATDVIERLSIEAALELTRDNRASAAEMLGLSRQSLYIKLRRFGLGDLSETESDTK
jgi:transcriptional regulator PpsR